MADIELIKPRELPAITNAQPTDAVMLDNGVTVGKVTPEQLVNAGAAVASEAEALAGVNNTKRMTPLRVRQVLDNLNNPAVLRAQAWAESSTPPDPLLPDSKSAKTWASIAEQGVQMVQWSMIAADGQTVLGDDITTGEPIRAFGGVAQISVNGFGPITPEEYSVDSDGVITLTAPLAEGDVVSGFTQPRLSNSEAQAVVQGVLQQTADDVAACEAILERIDLGALDAAVLSTGTDAETALLAKQASEQAAATAADDANAQIAPNVTAAVNAKNAAVNAKDAAQIAQAQAEAARDAAGSIGLINRGWVANAAALSTITSPVLNDMAMTLDNEHVWRWSGSAWVDTGESPLASKANNEDLVALRDAVYTFIPGNDLGIVSGVFVRSPSGEIKALIAITEGGVDIANRTNDAVGAMIGGDLLDAVRAGVSVFIPENDMGITDGIFWQSGAVLKANRYVANGISVTAEEADTPIFAPGLADVRICYGQSLAIGALATPAISTGLSKWGISRNALMLYPAVDGPRTFTRTVGGVTNYDSLPLDYWTGLTGLKEVTAQSIWPSFADAYLSAMDTAGLRAARMLCSITGLGSATYAQLEKGTSVYTLLLRNYEACRDMAVQSGLRPQARWANFMHGEAHSDTGANPATPAQYQSYLIQLLADLREDIGALYNQPERALRMCFSQTNRAFATGPALAQLALHKASPDFMLTGPKYQFSYADGVHLSNDGQFKDGELSAKAQFLTDLTGRKFDPLMITGYNLSGVNLDLTFNNNPTGGADHPGPIGPLVRDGGIFVTTPTGGVDGFGTEANLTGAIGPTTTAISSVTITSDTTVRVTFTSAPVPGQALNVGLRNCMGLRIRDSDDRWKSAYDGTALYNFAVADRITFA